MYSFNSKRHESFAKPEDVVLVVVDMQERFRTTILDVDRVVRYGAMLAKAAKRLGIPVLVTEQYPEKLGRTVSEILGVLEGHAEFFPKLSFSALGEESFYSKLKQLKKSQVVFCGVETHVCVFQTAMDLRSNFEGWITVAVDAVSSRRSRDRDTALSRMAENRISLETTEMILFEWLRVAGTPEFKEIQKLAI